MIVAKVSVCAGSRLEEFVCGYDGKICATVVEHLTGSVKHFLWNTEVVLAEKL